MIDQDVRDREAIRHLMARYNTAGDRGNIAGLAATFGDDGVLGKGPNASVGAAAIVEHLNKPGLRYPELTFTRHHLTTSLVEIDGDRATGRTYFQCYTDIGLDHHGVYVDELRKVDGQWFFATRDVRIDWQAPNSLQAPFSVRGRPPIAR